MRKPNAPLGRADPEVQKFLRAWSREPDRALAAARLAEAASSLPEASKQQLEDRLAEIALGFLACLEREAALEDTDGR